MMKIEKVLSLIVGLAFLCQNAAFCTSGASSALRAPLAVGQSTQTKKSHNQAILEWLDKLKEDGKWVGGQLSSEMQEALKKGEEIRLVLHIGPDYTPGELVNAAILRALRGRNGKELILGVEPAYIEQPSVVKNAEVIIRGHSDILLIADYYQYLPQIEFDEIRIIAVALWGDDYDRDVKEHATKLQQFLVINGTLLILAHDRGVNPVMADELKRRGFQVDPLCSIKNAPSHLKQEISILTANTAMSNVFSDFEEGVLHATKGPESVSAVTTQVKPRIEPDSSL